MKVAEMMLRTVLGLTLTLTVCACEQQAESDSGDVSSEPSATPIAASNLEAAPVVEEEPAEEPAATTLGPAASLTDSTIPAPPKTKPDVEPVAAQIATEDPHAGHDHAKPDVGAKPATDVNPTTSRVKSPSLDSRTATGPDGRPIPERKTPAPRVPAQSGPIVVKPTPSAEEGLHMGEVATGETASGIITLTNTADEPRVLMDIRTSCGCTTASYPKGSALQPGEAVDVEIRLSGGHQPRELKKYVTFIIENQDNIRTPVMATTVAYVVPEPVKMGKAIAPDGEFTLRAIDDQPFKITHMIPALLSEFPEEAKAEHKLQISWDDWDATDYRQRNLIFYIDHPKCTKVYLPLLPDTAKPRTQTQGRTPAQPPKESTFEQLYRAGRYDEAIKAIEGGTIDVNEADARGRAPLHKAAASGHAGLVQACLDASADVDAATSDGTTALMYAAQSSNVEALTMLLEAGADFRLKDQLEITALSRAAWRGNAHCVEALLAAGADVNTVAPILGYTPLIWAAALGNDPESILLLIEAGADVEAREVHDQATPLICAVRTGSDGNIKALLEGGANPNAMDADGRTPLFVAASSHQSTVKTFQMLIDAGADVTVTTKAGSSLLDIARQRTDTNARSVVEYLAGQLGVPVPPPPVIVPEVEAPPAEVPPAEAPPAEEPPAADGDDS